MAGTPPEEFTLHPEHAEFWELFLLSGPAWRYDPMGGVQGVSRAEFLATMRAVGTRKKRMGGMVADLGLVEVGIREALDERRKRQSGGK